MSCNNLNRYGYLLNKLIIYLKRFKDFKWILFCFETQLYGLFTKFCYGLVIGWVFN